MPQVKTETWQTDERGVSVRVTKTWDEPSIDDSRLAPTTATVSTASIQPTTVYNPSPLRQVEPASPIKWVAGLIGLIVLFFLFKTAEMQNKIDQLQTQVSAYERMAEILK